jgi:hypothetical protein
MKLFSPLLKIQNQLRIYHWQTKSYAQHKAFGEAYESLNDLIDSFIESYLGRYGSTPVSMTFKFELHSFDEKYIEFIDDCIVFLTNLSLELEDSSTDLLNIRDEMIAVFTRLKYLLNLQ